jgi:hypothetical protein
MFSKEQLEGIFLSIPTAEIIIAKESNISIGYRVRLRVCLRGRKDFLLGIQRSLLQYEIESKYKEKEHRGRPRPILIISGKNNLNHLMELIPSLPSNAQWEDFEDALVLCNNGEHLSHSGFNQILKMKGLQ